MRGTDLRERKSLFRVLKPLILASASPRRKELLEGLGLEFEVFPAAVEEALDPLKRPEELVAELSEKKARAVAELFPHRAVLAADTLVELDGRLMGKPVNETDAYQMLKSLSGRTHRVFTGVCLVVEGVAESFVTATEVAFRLLSEAEIKAYVATGEPMDKAGAYAIQGLAACFVTQVRGSFSGVVGLPLAETVELLLKRGVIEPAP